MGAKKAYRGYLIYSNMTHDWFIEKDSMVIYCGFSEKECRKQVDAILGPQ